MNWVQPVSTQGLRPRRFRSQGTIRHRHGDGSSLPAFRSDATGLKWPVGSELPAGGQPAILAFFAVASKQTGLSLEPSKLAEHDPECPVFWELQ